MNRIFIIVLIVILTVTTLFMVGCGSDEQSTQEDEVVQDAQDSSDQENGNDGERPDGKMRDGGNADRKKPNGEAQGNGRGMLENLPDKESLNLENLTDEEIELIDKLYNKEIEYKEFMESFSREKMQEVGLGMQRPQVENAQKDAQEN